MGEPGNDGSSYLQKCKSMASSNVYFWGQEKNPEIIKQLYRHATLTVIPSVSEMVPLVAFESLSQRTPVVCTNRCGIADDYIPGLVFSNIDKNSLIKSITRACEIERGIITDKGVYSWAIIAGMYKHVYEKVLENSIKE